MGVRESLNNFYILPVPQSVDNGKDWKLVLAFIRDANLKNSLDVEI